MQIIDCDIKKVFIIEKKDTQLVVDSIRKYCVMYWDEIVEEKNILILKPKGHFLLQLPEFVTVEYE